MSADQLQHEIARCRREIEAMRAELLAGNPDVGGLCLALVDWSAELRLLEAEPPPTDARGGGAEDAALTARPSRSGP